MKKYEMTRKVQGRVEARGFLEMKAAADGTGELYVYGDIVDDALTAYYWGGTCPQTIADFLDGLNGGPLTVYFNSPGGDVFAGMAIHSILQRYTGKKTGVVDGMAASIASVILMGCDTVTMNTGSQIMVHKPWCSGCGNAPELRRMAQRLDEAEEGMLDVYMLRAKENVSREAVAALLAEETWMRSAKAAEYFDIMEGAQPAMAAWASGLYGMYSNAPAELKEGTAQLVDDLWLYG